MITEIFEFIGCNGVNLPARIWLPEDTPRMVVQITHGMTEHSGRYDTLARALTAQRIAVAGFDLRGHGKNPGDPRVASLGADGWEATIEDMRCFFRVIQEKLPGLPHCMLGFSLGAILQREYLERYPQDADGVVLVGTGGQMKPVLSLAMAVVKGEIRKVGLDGTTPKIKRLSFETYNRKFAPNRTAMDWLCADKAQLDAYLADPMCRESISTGLFYSLLNGMKNSGRRHTGRSWRRETPVLLISGAEDPVGGFGKTVGRIARGMRKAGMKNVTLHVLPKARHDVLHEEDCGAAQAARKIIADWMMEFIGE